MQKKIRPVQLLLIAVLSISGAYAQPMKKEAPKLLVGITIDRLRSDYLQLFFDGFGERGFKRLMKEGLVYTDVQFEFPEIDKSSSVSTIYTGANPFYSGIVSDKVYDIKQKKIRPSLFDSRYMGNYTSETLSPDNILVSTIGDELKIATQGLCDVYAVAPEYQVALLSAGHAANGAFWLDDLNGRWATTTYFKEIPWYVDKYNSQESLATFIESKTWENMHPVSFYTYFPYIKPLSGFKYVYNDFNRFKLFKTSPLVNEEVNRLVERFFEYGTLGKKDIPDFLSVSYFAGSPDDKNVREYSVELQDTYFRLDKELEKLLDLIDKKAGLQNTVIFVASTGYFTDKETVPTLVNLPVGEFYPKRCLALLNMYLMAVYGQGNWVDTYYDKQIYLNRKLIEDKQIPIGDIQNKAADFLIDFSGIQDVFTSHDILHGRWNEIMLNIRNGFHRSVSGDLLLEILPGWKIVQEDNPSEKDEYVRTAHIPTPLIIMGPNVPAQTIQRKIKATQIAPSVSRLLRIRVPNASTDDALPEIR
ncbi:MAG: alkaline phosphatase family protein [Candidatus Azobacteroides sp.]|nr:alkaline phosphatase family protein [Candidatus Azobacteroides sp.]